MPRIT